MNTTFGLELIETALTSCPTLFIAHDDFSFLLKERVCPLIIRLFSPNVKVCFIFVFVLLLLAFLLKERLCPLIICLFSPNVKVCFIFVFVLLSKHS